MTTLRLRKSIGRSPWRRGWLLIPVALAFFALSSAPKVFGLTPAPDGGYPNQTTAEGQNALFNLTTGINNTALGFDALWNNTTGGYNTATGEQTLYLNVSGNYNTGNGYRALYSNTGSKNTADGFRALFSNTGNQNTAAGFQALYFNTTGDNNTAVGHDALYNNTSAGFNTATGYLALFHNTTSELNVAVGDSALKSFNGTTATDGANTALGSIALTSETSGQENTAVGRRALESLTAASNNTAVGWRAGDNIIDGSSDVAVGSSAGSGIVHASNVIAIGNVTGVSSGFGDADNTCYIGSIFNEPVGVPGTAQDVYVDQDGVLGFLPSSRRFKHDIKPMDNASEALLALKPVTFKYNSDKKGSPQYGLIAEEVAEVKPDLVFRNKKGEIASVRYEQINAMLLNEFLKEHRTVEDLKSMVAKQEAIIAEQQNEFASKIALQQKQIEALSAGLQQVSTQVEMSKPAPHMVSSNP